MTTQLNKNPESNTIQLALIALVIFNAYIGISLPYPVLAPMILNGHGIFHVLSSSSSPSLLIGILISAYFLGQFMGSITIGIISDHIGRKRTLLISLCGSTSGYLICALSILLGNYILFVLTRLFIGFCEGNITVVQAAAADLSEFSDKTKIFSIVGFAATMGYLVGPLLGGGIADNTLYLNTYGCCAVFIFGALISCILWVIIFVWFKDYQKCTGNMKSKPYILLRSTKELFKSSKIIYALSNYLSLWMGLNIFYEFYPVYFVGLWKFSATDIAIITACYTVPYALSQLIVVPLLSNRSTSKFIMIFSMLAGAGLLIILLCVAKIISYIIFPIFAVLMAFCTTTLTVFLANCVRANQHGQIFGIAASLNTLITALMAILCGLLAKIKIGLPLMLSAIILVLSAVLLFKNSIVQIFQRREVSN